MISINIGIIGVGFVGSALLKSFALKRFTPASSYRIDKIVPYDLYKSVGSIEEIISTDIVFICLPTPYDTQSNLYDMGPIHSVCTQLVELAYQGIVVIKSTIEPTTCDSLSGIYPLKICHNPEFLTARTAFEDFHTQTHIVIGKSTNCSRQDIDLVVGFYTANYPTATITCCSSTESESVKIFCNSFYAVKVQFFTELHELCERMGADYETISGVMLKNGWINPMHTVVPGPDGRISYGGACFPKDTNALSSFMTKMDSPNAILAACIRERNGMRDD